jgi:exosortase/archaeosortase family protein
MDKRENWILDIVLRYLIGAISFLAIPVFYMMFTPMTLGLTWLIMSLFYHVQISGNVLFFPGFNASVEIISACIAGSAYFLLFLLNIFTREIKILKRIYALLFSFACLFFVNILRLVLTISLFLNNSAWFDFTHKAFWFILSIVFVVLIWILTVKVFRISEVPVYSDVVAILKRLKVRSKLN